MATRYVVDVLVILLCFSLPHSLWPVSLFIIGTRQMGLSVIGHDLSHQRGRWAQWALWPMGIGLDSFRRHHFAHHRGVGLPTDPEVPHREVSERALARFGRFLFPMDCLGYGALHAGRLWLLFKPVTLADALGPLAFALILVAVSPWAAMLWFGAIPTVYFALFRARAFTEHYGFETFRKDEPNLLARLTYLPHGTWRHWEHHFQYSRP